VKSAKEWFLNDKATNEWLESVKESSRHPYQTAWKYFLEFTGMTGDQALESRKADKEYEWEKKVLEFKQWLIKEKDQSENSAVRSAATARSFFAFHRSTLQFRRTESVRLQEAKRKYEDYRFSREDLKKMADVSDLEEKYVIVAGKSFGLRAGDFLALARGDLEPYIDRPVPISIGEYSTQKESVKAYPFIDSDAQPIIKLMLEKMGREKRTGPNEQLLRYKDEIQLSRVLKRVVERAGINIGNKVVRFHCLRKFLIDRLSSHMSSEKWKQIVGKTISEGAYVSPDSLREDYTRAMTETCFAKTVAEGDIELMVKKQALMMLAKLQGISEEEQKRIFRARRASATDEQVKVLEELTEQKTQTDSSEEPKQMIVKEDELPNHLNHGWQFVSTLPSGKILIKKQA